MITVAMTSRRAENLPLASRASLAACCFLGRTKTGAHA